MSFLCLLAAAGVAALGSGAATVTQPPDLNTLTQATTAVPTWEPLEGALPAYSLDGEQDGLSPRHAARRHMAGGREDGLAIGTAETERFARLDILRGAVGSEPANLYVDFVRRAAASGASVLRMGQTELVPTKFGPVEAAPVVLAAGSERSCLAFRLSQDDLSFRLHGFLCSSPERATSVQELACFIDGLRFTGGSDDPAVRALFAQAEKRRAPSCGPTLRTLAARGS